MNSVLDAQEALRKKALEEQAGDPEALAAPVPVPMPGTPAAPDLAVLAAPKAPLYPQGATAEDLAKAYAMKRAADFRAQITDAGATLAHAFGAKTPENAGAGIRAAGETGIQEVLARRQLADQDRAQKGKLDSAQFSKWLFSKLPATAETAKAIGPEGMSQVAGLDPQQLVKEDIDFRKAQAAAAAKGAGGGKGSETQALLTLLPQLQKEYGWDDAKTEAFRQSVSEGLKGTTFRAIAQPSNSLHFDVAGNPLKFERKSGAMTSMTPPGSPPPDPGTGIAPSPRMDLERQKGLQRLGSPPPDFTFEDDILTGKKTLPNTHAYQDAHKQITGGAQVLDQAVPVMDFLKKHPDGFPAGADAAAVLPFVNSIQSAVRQAKGLGVYKAAEQPMIDRLVGDPTTVKNVLLSMTDLRPLLPEWEGLMNETKQFMWTAAQQHGLKPDPNGRLGAFKPRSALPAAPALPTGTGVQEPDRPVHVEVPPNAKEVKFQLSDGRSVWVPADKVQEALTHPAFKGAKQTGAQ